uniref:DUF7507 domain-containing protein n=1 Tax=uncultured Cocleimonas sp. TaxID=1051587 RepID=UPI00262F93C3
VTITQTEGVGSSFTMPDESVTCTLTNTRKSATLTLQKTWVDGESGDTASLTADGSTDGPVDITHNSISTGSNTDKDTDTLTIFAGDTVSVEESLGSTNLGSYDSVLLCTNGASGSTTGNFIVPETPVDVTCTFTNTRKDAELILIKTSDYLTSGDTDGSGDLSVGDVITYTMTATNSGATALTNVTITDDFISGALSCTPANGSTLAIGATLVCEGTYTVVAGDVGTTIINTASATSDQDDAPDATVNNPVASPELSLTKTSDYLTSGDTDGSGDLSVGDVITYTMTATNSGATALTNVTITDDFISGALSCTPANGSTLAIGVTLVCEGTYTVVAGDVGTTITNTASVTSDQYDAPDATVNNPVASPELSLTKTSDYLTSGDTDGSGDLSVGDVITYTMTATNSGATALTNVTITDDFISGALSCTPANGSTLAIGATLVCEGTYTVVAGDVGTTITNTASATSDQGDAPDATVNNSVETPEITLVKEEPTNNDADGSGNVSVGDTLTYTVTATNGGSVSLTNVIVSDPKITQTGGTTPCDVVAPGGTCTLIGTYLVTAADATNGNIVNIATANSDQTDPVDAEVTTPVVNLIPSLSINKAFTSNADEDGNGQVSLGDTLTYTVTGVNDGQLTLTNVTISDAKISPSNATCASLPVGSSCVLTGTYTVTSADVTAGSILNTGTVSSNQTPPADDSVTVDVPRPSLAIDKVLTSNADEDGSGNASVGDTLTYTITATNNGAAVLTNVIVSDPQLTPKTLTCPILQVGEKCTLVGTYVVTLADAAAGEFKNTGTGDTAQTAPVNDSVTIEIFKQPLKISGVVYDSTTRDPIETVILQLVNSAGIPVDDACLGADQQNQVTKVDGFYQFDILPSAHESCDEDDTYRIKVVTVPEGYFPGSSVIPVETTSFDSHPTEPVCTLDMIANSSNCEVQVQGIAPVDQQDTTYFVEFVLHSDDNDVINNHIPLDPPNLLVFDENSILLSKTVNKKQVSIADQLYYTLRAENLVDGEVTADIKDDLPTGFKLVSRNVKLTRAGVDKKLGTKDDVVTTVPVKGYDPVRFGPIDFVPFEIVQVGYLLKVGTGVRQGNWINTAQVFDTGTTTPISNIATASVQVVADSVLDDATLIGKVFHDRDGDGYQDPANATGITVKSDYFGWNSLHLGGLTGRVSVLDDPAKHRKIIRMPYSKNNRYRVTTQQGTVINVDHKGQISEAHVGAKAKGLTGQDLRVTTRRIKGIPTPTKVAKMKRPAVNADVLEITITNMGIHEEGIPGVRLATVKGLVIETDGFGRYHIPDVDAGRRGWGRNFIIKVDAATLPKGSKFTTENPRVLRITNTALNKINFGVKLPVQDPWIKRIHQPAKYRKETRKHVTKRQVPVYQMVEVNLGSIFFDKDKHHIRADQLGNMNLMANRIKQYGHGHITIDAHTDSRHTAKYNVDLARRRAFTVRQELQKRLGSRLMKNVKVEVDPRALREVPHNDPRSIDYNVSGQR